ncbi:unnamed protein product [Caenorhabditis sp. 36 PRJEB53466]|nr:unnamed protein product [Caenorhabditis sp. 36 PRJEB53466]
MSDNRATGRRRREETDAVESDLPVKLQKTSEKTDFSKEDSEATSSEVVEVPSEPALKKPPGEAVEKTAKNPTEDTLESPPIDVCTLGDDDVEEIVMPSVTSSGEVSSHKTPTTAKGRDGEEEEETGEVERVFSSFPCQVIPETLSRMTRTPPDGEHLEVRKNANGRLRILVIDHYKKFSPYSNLTHKPCTVCNRVMKAGEMHLNFPADLDRRRIWANLLGFKYKDILRSKMGPVSFSIAAGPICTEHFAEECFRNHNFNKSAIEAFGVPVAISPDVKTTPSKKRVPWVCTICEFHSCSVVELQNHLLDHTEEMLKKKDNMLDVPEAGFMCPFCRKCTYGYKTVSGYRRHLLSPPIQHCHLRRIYEFAKMNCRASELDPSEAWDNWTRRNVYVAYHGCEPPANEIVLTPSPTKSVYNPEERTRLVQDEERHRKAVRSLAFVGKEGGTSVNDHNVMQRAVYLQVRRNQEHKKRYPEPEDLEQQRLEEERTAEEREREESEEADETQSPMGSDKRTSQRHAISAGSSPVKKPTASSSASLPPTPKKRKFSSEEHFMNMPRLEVNDPRERLRQKIRDEQFAKMVQKRSQQVKRLINAKLKKEPTKKPRKALACNLSKGAATGESSVEAEDTESSISEQTPERSAKKSRKSATPTPPTVESEDKSTPTPIPSAAAEKPEEPEERPLKSMLARSLTAGMRPSMAKYHVPLEAYTSSVIGARSLSSGSIPSALPVAKKGGLFTRIAGAAVKEAPAKRPTVLARRPLILSPRKRAIAPVIPVACAPIPISHRLVHHESSPIITTIVDEEMQLLIPEKEMEVEMIEEVIEETIESEIISETSSSVEPKPIMTLAEALEMKRDGGSGVKDQELEVISKEMMRDSQYYQAMEDAIKCRTVTKMRADLRLSRHCIRQIEAARARARLFGEGSEDYQILYTDDGAQVVTKNDPKWRELQQQQQQQQLEEEEEHQEAAEPHEQPQEQ